MSNLFPKSSLPAALRRTLRRGLVCGLLSGWWLLADGRAAETPRPPDRPLVVSAANDNFPYSYTDDSGALTGFAVDVFDAVARRMDLSFNRVALPAMEDLRRFGAGEFDVGQWHPHIPGHDSAAEYSVPILVVQGALFVRKGDRRFAALADVRRQHARVATPTQGQLYALAQGLDPARVTTAASPECLRLLADGQVDVVLLTRLTGLAQAHHLGLTNIETVGPSLDGFTVRYCFAVHRGGSALVAQLNEGLAILFQTGEYERIYQKWFARYEPAMFPREQVIRLVAVALGLALLGVLWALARQRQLRRRIARQAEELDESRGILAEAQSFARLGYWRHQFGDPPAATWSEETFRIFERDPRQGVPDMDAMIAYAIAADRGRWRAAVEDLRDTGRAYDLQLTIEPRTDLQRTIHIRARPANDHTGRRTGTFGTVQDVTAWHSAEEALRQSEQLLRALYDNLPLALGVVERVRGEWLVVSLNPAAVHQFDLPAAPPVGRALSHLGLAPEWLQYWSRLFTRCVDEGQPLNLDLNREEQKRAFAITLVPLGQAAGRARCCFLVEDVSERRQKDAEIAQGRRLRAIGELVGGIAHEFNNLLTPILLNSDLLQTEWAHVPALHQELKMISDAARRSAELTRRLLAFGRKSDQQSELLDLRAIVETNAELVRHAFDRRIRIEATVPADLPPLYLNSADLHQILLNLLVNARDTLVEKLAHPPPGDWVPCIHIEAIFRPVGSVAPFEPEKHPTPAGWVRLTVRDNGRGMSPAVRERIFEPFYTTKQVGQGTGLGLATVWHLVVGFGGRVTVESVSEEGSAFHVFLPYRALPSVTAPLAQPDPAVPGAPARSLRLLLVEDEAVVASLIATLLKRQGHQVALAANGLDGWERLSANPESFDGVIMDLNMPGLNGLELARRARALAYDRPLVAVSGRVTEEDRTELARLGVETILQKPFTLEELRSALTAAFSAAAP